MVYNNFKNALESEGVEKISAKKGDEFNHNLHFAIEEVETNDVEPGQIVEVKIEGYTLKGRLLRPTSVVTAKAKGSEEPEREN